MSKQNINRRSTAHIQFHGLHVASIGREAFEAIADQPVFDDHRGPPTSYQLTWRRILQSAGPSRDKRRQRVRLGAGLLDRAVAALRAQGHTPRGHGQRRQCLGRWTEAQPHPTLSTALGRAYGRPSSLLMVPTRAKQIRFIGELCKLQPESHVLVVVKNHAEARKVGQELATATGRSAKWTPDQPYGSPWLLVKSLCSLAGCAPMSGELIVFFDAELALSLTSMQFLTAAQESTRIAFLTRDERQLHAEERAVLEALFGPVIFRPGDGIPMAEVLVAWLPWTKRGVPRSENVADPRRSQIWRNDARNQFIARAARSLHANNNVALGMLGLREAATWLCTKNCDESPSVAIVAANVEHGHELARLLPGWRLEAAGFTPPAGRIVDQERTIVTLSRATEDLLATTAVVFAAGGHDWWLEHVYGLACPGFGPQAVLVVDVVDGADPQSKAVAESRAAGYRSRRYRQITVTPSLTPTPGTTKKGGADAGEVLT